MVCRCDGEYNKFISGIFGECVSGTQGVVSFIFGWISICCWIIAYVPQIRINFLLKRSDALSTVFLLCWIFGDMSNLISCFMLNQLFTQQILSVLFIGFDVVLVGQQFYYQRPKNQAISLSIKLRISEALVYTFVIVIIVNNILWGGFHNQFGLQLQEMAYDMCSTPKQLEHSSAQYIIGNVVAYISLPLYFASRPGQIIKNHRRKSAVGLSLGMFFITSSANYTQLVSLLTMSQEREYLIQKIPYILACILPASCDVIIIMQWFVYSKADKVRGSKKELEKECNLEDKEIDRVDTVEMTVSTFVTGDNK
ncbi:Seven_transmembrane protein 1 [Hexamita inflata]|uniref:Seven transmembrane protein 1 n=1 Tax=Hexamita inflata TaxID=28002 RepID=A0AA86V320_9EUKA|nr:Seven transmembrane protein 1 [Hexamita inflata]CAI9974276.1 Seven transmembrane protein 1 [Hexamita inflata]